MSIPTQTEMYGIVLGLMNDGGEYTRRSMKQKVLSYLDLTAEETLQKTDSGVLVYESRVGWAISYLSRAQLISRTNRGVYVINDEGKNTLKENLDPDALWYRLDDRIRTLDPWKTGVKKQKQQVAEDGKVVEPPAQSGAVSPQEQISSLASELDANLADELLALIMDHDSDFFERIVVQLLEKMGYGRGGRYQALFRWWHRRPYHHGRTRFSPHLHPSEAFLRRQQGFPTNGSSFRRGTQWRAERRLYHNLRLHVRSHRLREQIPERNAFPHRRTQAHRADD